MYFILMALGGLIAGSALPPTLVFGYCAVCKESVKKNVKRVLFGIVCIAIGVSTIVFSHQFTNRDELVKNTVAVENGSTKAYEEKDTGKVFMLEKDNFTFGNAKFKKIYIES